MIEKINSYVFRLVGNSYNLNCKYCYYSEHKSKKHDYRSSSADLQMGTIAQKSKQNNIKLMRGGSYKPRTSPYTFQGFGLEGLQLLKMHVKNIRYSAFLKY